MFSSSCNYISSILRPQHIHIQSSYRRIDNRFPFLRDSLAVLSNYPLHRSYLFLKTLSCHFTPLEMSAHTYTLPALPYAYDVRSIISLCWNLRLTFHALRSINGLTLSCSQALEPSISAQIMELHHSKHHQAYVTNLNIALKSQANAISSSSPHEIATQISLQCAIKFNGGGHINYSLFWENLAPSSSDEGHTSSAPNLAGKINKVWHSMDEFKAAFGKALLGIQGSGWGWLAKDTQDRLCIITTKDQDPVVGDQVPIFGVDMWEHAYYLQVCF
jgi:Fe-Mn family superoxide dismutase